MSIHSATSVFLSNLITLRDRGVPALMTYGSSLFPHSLLYNRFSPQFCLLPDIFLHLAFLPSFAKRSSSMWHDFSNLDFKYLLLYLLGITSIGSLPLTSTPWCLRSFILAGLFVQHVCSDPVVPLVVLETQRLVSLEGVVTEVLELVCPDFVRQADTATLLSHIEEHSVVMQGQLLHRNDELVVTIAPQRAERVPCQALGVDPYKHVRLLEDIPPN